MELDFIIICDNAFTDETGRLNVIQAFDTINASNFPALHPRMSVVTRWNFTSEQNKGSSHTHRLDIIDEVSNKNIADSSGILTAQPGKNRYLQIINNFVGLKFDHPGRYKVHAYIDGEKSSKETYFEVSKT